MASPASGALRVAAPPQPEYRGILSSAAIAFLSDLIQRFTPDVESILEARTARQARADAGELPDFLPETASIREADWTIGEIPSDLRDRRVEITGPVDRKMIINALNSGARVFMADFEDSLSPTWENIIGGQQNLRDAVRRKIELVSPEGKVYRLNRKTATLIVRPRGWHLTERHITRGDRAVPAALVDFGLYVFHNAGALAKRGTGPYLYLPKLESHLEARLWAKVLRYTEETLGLTPGTIKVTVLIETIFAAFEMDEILYELRDNIVGLNCGRWDYIFSFIKKFAQRSDFVLPDREQVTMTTHFLRSYSLLCIKTCHRREAFALGGMAAQIPIKDDPVANEQALTRVRADKQREATDGHDGTWVAHPGLVPIARETFDRVMQSPNNLHRKRADVNVTARDLLTIPEGTITERGLRNNVTVALQYLAAWLSGNGCVPIHHLMEDAATAEISRAQLWQWIHHPKGVLDDGRRITLALVEAMIEAARERLGADISGLDPKAVSRAAQLLAQITSAREFAPFLTTLAYPALEAKN